MIRISSAETNAFYVTLAASRLLAIEEAMGTDISGERCLYVDLTE